MLFSNEFTVSIAAGSLRKRDEAARLRYQVFCQEFHFEPTNAQQREQDQFDKYAEFALINSKRHRCAAGCLRVIMPEHDEQLLPMEQYCRQAIEGSPCNLTGLPRNEICEVSRLAVHADFRGDHFQKPIVNNRAKTTTQVQQRNQYASLVSISLLALAAMIAQKHRRPHVLSMMEPRLARGLRLGGIPVVQAGDVIEYHGKRAPFYVTADEMLSGIAWKHPDLIETIEQQLDIREPCLPTCRPAAVVQPAHAGALAD